MDFKHAADSRQKLNLKSRKGTHRATFNFLAIFPRTLFKR